MSTSTEQLQLAIPIATTNDEEISDEGSKANGFYYDNTDGNTKLRRHKNIYVNIDDAEDEDDNTNPNASKIGPNMLAKITGVVIAPQFNGKQVEILSYNDTDETWTVQFEHYDNEMEKYLNIREEFLVFLKQNSNKNTGKNGNGCSNNSNGKSRNKQLMKLQTYSHILLALIVISCTCLLLTPFWSFSSLIFGRNDGYIYYLSYTFFCGLMCLIIWSKKINLKKNSNNIFNEFRNCSIESIICYIFYMFCCVLLWGMASYFGGFFFIYLWYCSQEIHSTYKRCNYFDIFMNKYKTNRFKINKNSGNDDDSDIIKRSICVYYYCLNNVQSNIHKIYKIYIMNSYLRYTEDTQFKLSSNKEIDINNIFYTKHWFPNINLSHNLPFVAGIAGYHFMIWFAVFYLNISDWS
eukprot:150074_1